MSIMDKFKEFFSASGLPESYALHHAPGPAGEVLAALRGVIDPEMGINIVNIGMVREISVEDGRATVVITTTTPGCPLADWLVEACAGWLDAHEASPPGLRDLELDEALTTPERLTGMAEYLTWLTQLARPGDAYDAPVARRVIASVLMEVLSG